MFGGGAFTFAGGGFAGLGTGFASPVAAGPTPPAFTGGEAGLDFDRVDMNSARAFFKSPACSNAGTDLT